MSKKVVNHSDSMQFVSGIKAFRAKEVRDVSDDTATMLLANPNFSLYDSGTNLDKVDEDAKTFTVAKKPSNKKLPSNK